MPKKILNKKRVQALNFLRKNIVKSLELLERKEKNKSVKNLYKRMIASVKSTPLLFYDTSNLSKSFFVEVKGVNVSYFEVKKVSGKVLVKKNNLIKLPAKHFFSRERISISGVFSLCHEYAHFPKKESIILAEKTFLTLEQAEELYADILASKVALQIGFTKKQVIENLQGRQLVYHGFPYMKVILKAISK